MKPNEILTLLNAGYTKADIDAMLSDAAGGSTAPAGDPPAPDPAPDPTPDPAPKPAGDDKGGGSDALQALQATVAELAKSVKAMQAANLAAARQDPPPPKATAESAIKNFMSRM